MISNGHAQNSCRFGESPEALLTLRFQALAEGDFATLYASYQEGAPLLQQFADRAAYLRFSEQQLRQVRVVGWQMLGRRQLAADRLEQLLAMEITVGGQRQFFYELALLVRTAAGWRYHSAQKLSEEDYPGTPDEIDFCHFDQAPVKIRI
jgi:SEC-C motif domain protein